MATKTFTSAWVAIYRGRNGRYHSSDTPMRIGGFNDDISFIGVPNSLKDALESAVGTPTVTMKFYVTDGGSGVNIGGHSQTYNKAGGATPAITNYGGNHSTPAGWKTVTLPAALVTNMKNGSMHGVVLYGGGLYVVAHGKTGNSYQVSFTVTGEWNTPPNPSGGFVNPKASTVADTSVKVDWQYGTDGQTAISALRYELGYYDGSKWAEYWTTGANVLTWNYPLSGRPETSSARFAVRTIDAQGAKSAWVYSPYFTVNHNKPPSAPTNLTPRGGAKFDRTNSLLVSWKNNDDGVQAGYQIAWRTVSATGAFGNFNYYPAAGSAFANITRNSHTYGANTFPLGEIEWTVRTKDQQGEVSPWSARERLYAGEPSDAPIILSPENGGVVNTSNLTIRWSSLDQLNYRVELYEGEVLRWSENRIGGNKAVLADYALENSKSYRIRMRVMSRVSGLWSEWAEIGFTTAFTPPIPPVLTVETAGLDNAILSWSTPPASGGTPEPTRVEIFRREYNVMEAQPWLKLTDDQTVNGSMVDYTLASSLTYEYKARVWGFNDTFSDSNIVEATLFLERSFIHRAAVPSDLIVVDAEEREEDFNFDGAFMKFAGRAKRVFEVSEFEERAVPLEFSVDSVEELRQVIAFLRRKETLLYRDTVGRRFYAVTTGVKVNDKIVSGFTLSLTLEEVDYTEGEEVLE